MWALERRPRRCRAMSVFCSVPRTTHPFPDEMTAPGALTLPVAMTIPEGGKGGKETSADGGGLRSFAGRFIPPKYQGCVFASHLPIIKEGV